MAAAEVGRRPVGVVVVVVLVGWWGVLAGVGPATADVTSVTGRASGYAVPNLTIFGGTQTPIDPTPDVALATDASNSPQTATVATGSARFGPATLFSSNQISVGTQGTLGAGGSVTSSTDIMNVNTSLSEVFTADRLQSTCTASESGVSGSTTVTNGSVRTSENPGPDGTFVAVAANPAPDTTVAGQLEGVGDSFQAIFNEQTTDADGSLTVTAYHLKLLGPTAVGDVYVGRVTCGVTGTGASSSTSSSTPGSSSSTSTLGSTTSTTRPATTTTRPTTTTTSRAPTTTFPTTTSPAPTTTAPMVTTVTDVSGSAYGYFTSVGLFGGAPATRGPAPTVTLPPGGSATPITASAPTGEAVYGPAQIFTSGRIEVSTQGTTGAGGSVTSTANIQNANRGGQEQLTASAIASKCTASDTGITGSVTLTGGRLITNDNNPDNDNDDTIVDLPASPAPNTSYDGKLNSVGDTYRVVLNEQTTDGATITVNAVHTYLLGPTAVGDSIVGQVKCGLSATTTGGGPGGAGGAAGGTAGPGSRNLAGTGNEAVFWTLLALDLMLVGWMGTRRVVRRRSAPPELLPADRQAVPRR